MLGFCRSFTVLPLFAITVPFTLFSSFSHHFVIKGIENCEKRQLEVRNQSGNIVFRSSHYENEWNGDNCPDGTYRFQLIYSSHNISQTLTGTVTIIRK